jgi:hypothetical protein
VGHTYALRLRARDAAGNWSPWVETAPFTPELWQDTSPTLARAGGWTRYRLASLSGGTSLYSRNAGASVTRTFHGRAVALVASKGPKKGKARIYVDGSLAGTVDLYRSVARYRVLVFTRAWATAGAHTVRVVVVGTPARPRVDVDTFVVVP